MKLKELLDVANEGYGDDSLREYYREDGTFNPEGKGDTLAESVAANLIETFDPDMSDEAQLCNAIQVIDAQLEDLKAVQDALERRLGEVQKTQEPSGAGVDSRTQDAGQPQGRREA